MSTVSVADSQKKASNGIRPVNIRQDLGRIADLLELCFENMDSAGRVAIREMRMLTRYGPLLRMLQGMDKLLKGLVQGYVWIEDGQLIGNVSIYPAGHENTWVIANVAVHPDYRRRGIAEKLCRAALERITEWKGQTAILQVDADNAVAQRLYERIGFHAERTFTRWRWSSQNRPPRALDKMPYITFRSYRDWPSIYRLMEAVRPTPQGGMGWMRPTNEKAYRPSPLNFIKATFNPGSREFWVVRGNKHVQGMILAEMRFGSWNMRFDMLVHPDYQGQLEDALINYLLRRAANQLRGTVTEHPADDAIAEAIFRKYGFEAERSLVHMRWQRI